MADANDILRALYAAYGTDSGILLGIPPDRKSSVKAIVDFTIERMSTLAPHSCDSIEFVDKKCNFNGCRIRPYCINLGRVCAAVCQDNPVPNDTLDRSLIVVFDDNPTLVKAPDVTDVWARQYKRWLNLAPPARTYDVNFRIIEKSKFLAGKQEEK
jgi:hypothetical protein